MVSTYHTTAVNTVPVLTPFDPKRKRLPNLGEGATVVITATYYDSRANTISACIEQVKPFESQIRPDFRYTDKLYGLRTERGYQVMFSAELKRRLIAYAWSAK